MDNDIKYFKCPDSGASISLVICAARQALENEKCAKCGHCVGRKRKSCDSTSAETPQ